MDPLEEELKAVIIGALRLEDLTVQDIADDAPLFGEGLGLDSIDALELGVAVQKRYAVGLPADPAQARQVFASVRSLAFFLASQGVRPGVAS